MTRRNHLGVSESLLRRYPEYLMFSSREELRRFNQTTGKRFSWRLGLGMGLCGGAPMVLTLGLLWDHGCSPWLALPVVLVLYVVTSNCLERLFVRRWYRRQLRRLLCEHGLPICLDCGYDLRGLSEDRCPECGCGRAPKAETTTKGDLT